MTRWGMVIDLQKCIGCQTCTAICQQTHQVASHTPWRRVVECEMPGNPEEQRLFLPMGCMHCTHPPCLEVCPTTATYRRPDGIVDIDYERCVGCGYCMMACPYLARSLVSLNGTLPLAMGTGLPETSLLSQDLQGVCTKCNFCLPRIEAGLAQGLQPGVSPEASPACVIFCTAHALHFGDLEDAESPVSRLINERTTVRLQEALETDPAVHYLVGNLPLKGQELVPPMQQQVWGWPAVLNFVWGGMGTGVYLLGLLMTVLGMGQPAGLKLLAPVLVSLGFLAVTMEAGRPLRAPHLLRHLGRSWMSREALAGLLFLPLAFLDWLFPSPVFQVPAAIAAAGLMLSQGYILYRARAVTAWNVPLMPLLFVTMSLTAGIGLMLMLTPLWGGGSRLVLWGVIGVVLNLVLWLSYLYRSADTPFQKAIGALRQPHHLFLTVGVGYLLPLLLFLAWGVSSSLNIGVTLQPLIVVIAGLAILVGGLWQKQGIIRQAGYLRGVRV
ncbi:MAG: hypothetical protein D6736_06770 [Nitrospinota bacterium]|nr:MAG: hypothetical protein D6736_06770 [Nitrospinota bacterium]